MSKAVLIIDMPKTCASCPCASDEEGFCRVKNEYRPCMWARPTWCPLRPYKDYIPKEWIKKWCGDEPYWSNLAMHLIEDWDKENVSAQLIYVEREMKRMKEFMEKVLCKTEGDKIPEEENEKLKREMTYYLDAIRKEINK